MTLQKGHNSTKGDNPDFKKICVNYFWMRNPYKKFQNCIFINFVTNARTDKAKAICPFNFFKVKNFMMSNKNSIENYTKVLCCACGSGFFQSQSY